MPEPTYDELSAEFAKLLDEREEWRRNIREQGAEIAKLISERNAALDRADDAWTRVTRERDELERDEAKALRERDDRGRVADDLAEAIARLVGVEIGEHSSANDPWANALAAATSSRTEAEQLRYERRLLGACRRHLDEIADPEGRYTAEAIRTAGDLAQRIVDEIGHPVTDEPALGPEFRERIAELERELEWAVAERDHALGQIKKPDYEKLVGAYLSGAEPVVQQRERMRPVVEAAQAWRGATLPHMPSKVGYEAEARLVDAVDAYDDYTGEEPDGNAPIESPGEYPDEMRCGRCGGPNVRAWCAPSPLWNQVMRGGDIGAGDRFGGIVCPVCFAQLAEEAGIAQRWRFYARRVHVELHTTTPSGRVWNPETWLWEDVSDVHRPTAYLPIGSPHREACLVCDQPWPCADAASPETIRGVAVALARRAADGKDADGNAPIESPAAPSVDGERAPAQPTTSEE